MSKEEYLFTSESVSEGHPDKICDQISDSILEFCLEKNSNSRVACEVFVTGRKVIIGGEITPKPKDYDVIRIVKMVFDRIGYKDEYGISSNNCEIEILIQGQSDDINQGVDKKNEPLGSGDQGIMFGYANRESEELMPLPIVIAHDLVKTASILRKKGQLKWSRPDMKSQVTLKYIDNKVYSVETILMSIQHDENYNDLEFKKDITENVIKKVVNKYNIKTENFNILINPTGKFTIGGPLADTGLTGRKIMVDTYGGKARHGGGAFSGKDYTKSDRSASYMCRYVAKNIVAANIADEFEIEVSYAIGKPRPLSFWVETKGTSEYTNNEIINMIKEVFDFSIDGMIKVLDLKNVKYSKTSTYGHFGQKEFSWEKINKVNQIKKYFNLK